MFGLVISLFRIFRIERSPGNHSTHTDGKFSIKKFLFVVALYLFVLFGLSCSREDGDTGNLFSNLTDSTLSTSTNTIEETQSEFVSNEESLLPTTENIVPTTSSVSPTTTIPSCDQFLFPPQLGCI
ncbi:MAG: hypothetical protein HQM14_00050 [SAR324 cluster bacterium]|nr:hypothetical protein [SAR324 cluster bacterium]